MYLLCPVIFVLTNSILWLISTNSSFILELRSFNNVFILEKILISNKSSITDLRDQAGNCIKGIKELDPNTTTWWNDLWFNFNIFCSKNF